MEIGFSPVQPPSAIRRTGELRVPVRQPGQPGTQEQPAPVRPEANQPAPSSPSPLTGRARIPATPSAGLPARADFFQARVQPDLPAPTRRALDTFVQNSFSEAEDPASGLGGIDVFA